MSTSINAFLVLWLVCSISVISSYILFWPYSMWQMIALSVAKLKLFSLESEISLWIKQKKKRHLEVHEKVRNVLICDRPASVSGLSTTRYYTTSHLHQVFFNFAQIFLLFLLVFRTYKLLEFKEFDETINLLFHLRLLDMRLVSWLGAPYV